MVYSPVGLACGPKRLSLIEMTGIKSLIKAWCGLDINLVEGGPSVVDPCGEYVNYISFRDGYNNAIAIRVCADGKMELIPVKEKSNNV
jgi:hypothetical protein